MPEDRRCSIELSMTVSMLRARQLSNNLLSMYMPQPAVSLRNYIYSRKTIYPGRWHKRAISYVVLRANTSILTPSMPGQRRYSMSIVITKVKQGRCWSDYLARSNTMKVGGSLYLAPRWTKKVNSGALAKGIPTELQSF